MGESEELLNPLTLKTQAQQMSQPRIIETDVPLQQLVKMASKVRKLTIVTFDSWREDLRVVLSGLPLGEAILFGEITPEHPQYSSNIDENMGLVVLSCIEKDIGEPNNVALIISDIPEPCKGSVLFKALQAAYFKTISIQRKELEIELCKLRYQGSVKELKERFNQIVTKLQKLGRQMTDEEKMFRVKGFFFQAATLSNTLATMGAIAHSYPDTESWFNVAIAIEEAHRASQARSLTTKSCETRTCHLCKKQGHIIKNCPKNKKKDNDTQSTAKTVKKETEDDINQSH